MLSGSLNIDLIILFFFLGAFASWAKSDLHLPDAVQRFLSVYLLLALGLKGGREIRSAESLSSFAPALLVGMIACILIPLILYPLLRKRVGNGNAAALAAGYGSVSAVTFIAAEGFLTQRGIAFSGHMVAVMALMEIPAILIALGLYRFTRGSGGDGGFDPWSLVTMKSVVLLLGGFGIGAVLSDASWAPLQPVFKDAFKGALAFFLLALGREAQLQFREASHFRLEALLVGLVFPILIGLTTVLATGLLPLSLGDRILLATLAGSASYIAAPAAIQASVPEANPSLYVALPLALTFPMNVVAGIPLYVAVAQALG